MARMTTCHDGKTLYRPDIDGLRAIAVLSVVLYHLNKAWVPGGYVGVDIFFVVSGFLITRNIWGEMVAGRFSLANFYLRRIRRIAPAFLVMTVVVLLIGSALLLPDDLLRLAKSALWGAVSLSNLFFWRHLDTSYFADSSDEVPLLHTWSLGVEEQFYFIWPTLLLLALRLPKRRAGVLMMAACICVASFACGELTNTTAQKFSYYMLPARAGELMIGALLALWEQFRIGSLNGSSRDRWQAEVWAFLGFGLVAYSLYMLNDTSKFPGINAIYPCVGAALLMLAGERDSKIVQWLLTSRPVVFIGLISYSLYLWHWPVLAFIRYFYGSVEAMRAVLAVTSISILSVLSYRYIELPARRWKARPLRQVLALYAIPSAALCFVAIIMVASGGLESLIKSSPSYRYGLARIEKYTAPAYEFPYNCQLSNYDSNILHASRCIIGSAMGANRGREPGMLLWGDSEAAHYIGVLGQFAKLGGFAFRNATYSACPPMFGGDYGVASYKVGCDKFRPLVQAAILSGSFRTVVISGAWSNYARNLEFRQDLERTLSAITAKGIHVVILGEAPYFPNYNRNCELRALRVGGGDCEKRLTMPDVGKAAIDRYLESLASVREGVTYVDARSVICHDGVCSPYVNGRPVYYNSTHLSMEGSWLIGEKLMSSDGYSKWSSVINAAAAAPVAARSPERQHYSPSAHPPAFAPRAMPPLLDGYTPNFPYHMRSESHSQSRKGAGGVVLEFWGLDVDAVASRIEDGLVARGFRLILRMPSGNAVLMRFAKPGLPSVSVNVGPLGTLVPQAPSATGVVYYHW